MIERLPFRLGSVEIVKDDSRYQEIIDRGMIPITVRCTTCGATSTASIVYPERDELVRLAHRLSRWDCPERGHGVGR